MDFPTHPAPHTAPITTVGLMMRRVLYALSPAAVAHVWFFGWGFAINLVLAATTAVAFEYALLRLRGQPREIFLTDGSALVTAALLTFALPPLAPFWLPIAGTAVAMILGKHALGGLGFNPFNPAMVGYAALLLSFPAEMTAWLAPRMGDLDYPTLSFLDSVRYALAGTLPGELTFDAVTRATPLDFVKNGLANMSTMAEVRANPLMGDFGGRGWEWIGNFIFLGGIYLLFTGVIRWHIPVSMLAAIILCATLGFLFDSSRFPSPGFHVFSGATLLGAFFIATDPVSAASSPKGRLIYGAGIGALTYIIRTWGGYPDGVAFAVLLMNFCVPLIDRLTVPRVYGVVK